MHSKSDSFCGSVYYKEKIVEIYTRQKEKETRLPDFVFCFQKRIKIRKLETELIENVIFAICLQFY